MATLFQQRWIAKRLLRAYHGDHIRENSFKKWYMPRIIPDVRPPQVRRIRDTEDLDRFRGATRRANLEKDRKSEMTQKGIAPVGSLMWAEVERRIDVFVFRCCFAHSVYEARRMIIHGYCKLNGRFVSFQFFQAPLNEISNHRSLSSTLMQTPG